MSNKYIEPIKPDYVKPDLMPSGQPVPSAPQHPHANPGAAPRIDVGNGWGKDQK